MFLRDKEKSAFYSCTFVINPTRFPEYAKILKKILKRIEVPLVIESESKDHFIDSVRAFCRSEYEHLLVWGGDGTAHDAVNTLTEEMSVEPDLSRRKSIGFLRGGSGNGIQDSYEVPFGTRRQIKTYAESMQNNYVVDVDLLRTEHAGSAAYCQLVGFGFDAKTLQNRAVRIRRFGKSKGLVRRGMSTYLLSVLKTYFGDYKVLQAQSKHLELYNGKYAFRGTRVNAEMPFEFLSRDTGAIEIEVGSRPYYGRLFKICPDVVCNDGYLDVYLYNFEDRFEIIQNAVWLWSGRHDRINKKFARNSKALIERYEVTRVDVSAAEPFDYHIDGEVERTTEAIDGQYTVKISVLPRHIRFLVPGTFYRKFHPAEHFVKADN